MSSCSAQWVTRAAERGDRPTQRGGSAKYSNVAYGPLRGCRVGPGGVVGALPCGDETNASCAPTYHSALTVVGSEGAVVRPLRSSRPAGARLLPADVLICTDELDQAQWSYRPGPLGYVQRKRFALAADLLGDEHDALLELGYGSGIFMPELAERCHRLFGADRHDKPEEVAAVLQERGISAELVSADAADLPFPDETFDAVVVVSALEFVSDVDAVCEELTRVLRPEGTVVAITPGYHPMLDVALRVLTGERAEDTFQGRRQRVIPALMSHFRNERIIRFPPLASGWLYSALRCRKLS